MPDNEQNTKRDLDRLRTQYAQKEVELEEQMRKIARLEAQLKQQKKSKDDLQSETEIIRNTCRQFKDQAEKLR
jgi:septal ring factor EnvC (AmiA/AmiB activator)